MAVDNSNSPTSQLFEAVPLNDLFSDDENCVTKELSKAGIVIFNQLSKNLPVFSIPKGGDLHSGLHVFQEDILEVNYNAAYLMFILTIQEKQRSRLILELGTEVTVKHVMRFARIVIPVQPIPKKPNQFMVDWILKKLDDTIKKDLEQKEGIGSILKKYMTNDDKCCMKFMIQPSIYDINKNVVRGYYVVYCNFIVSNREKTRKELKELLGMVKNWPKFLQQHFPEANFFFLLNTTYKFLVLHKCALEECEGFSLVKCSSCKSAHYCNIQCQQKDFERHSSVCGTDASLKKYKICQGENCSGCGTEIFIDGQLGRQLEVMLSERGYFKGKVLTFQEFISIINLQIFEAAFNSFERCEFFNGISLFTFKTTAKHVGHLLKDRTKSLPAKHFEKQLFEVGFWPPPLHNMPGVPDHLKNGNVDLRRRMDGEWKKGKK